jgi:hypothetical protein
MRIPSGFIETEVAFKMHIANSMTRNLNDELATIMQLKSETPPVFRVLIQWCEYLWVPKL